MGAAPPGRVPVSLVIVTYNSAGHIGATLEAVLADPTGPDEVIVVDNASSDGTAAVVAGYPVRWLPQQENLGFGAGCHAGVAAATHPVVAFLNPDAVCRPGWLPPLLAAVEEPAVGAAMATIEQATRPGHFNTSGGALTYFGLAWVTDTDTAIPAEPPGAVTVPFPSGAAMVMTREVWTGVGGFRPDLFLYHEDSDLGWRLRLAGLRCVRLTESRVAHDYDFSRNPRKFFSLERNRLLILAANYRWSTLLVLAPALLAVEAGVGVVAVRDGWWREKLQSWWAVARSVGDIRREHRRVQASRRVGDAAVLAEMATDLGGITQVTAPRGVAVVNRFLSAYLRTILPVVRRADARAGFDAD